MLLLLIVLTNVWLEIFPPPSADIFGTVMVLLEIMGLYPDDEEDIDESTRFLFEILGVVDDDVEDIGESFVAW